MKILVCGCRDYTDYVAFKDCMNKALSDINDFTLVSGGAKGVDSMAERYARDKGCKIEVYKAEWSKYGRGAGFKRNREMVDIADMTIAFWDNESRGTKHSIEISKEKGITVIVFDIYKISGVQEV